jgi:hypothetical protein
VRDWQSFVRERLDLSALDAAQQNEITAEMASHLEDICEDRQAHGLCGSDAARIAGDEVPNWNRLSRLICRSKRAEPPMNDRTRQLWLPGFASLAGSNLLLMVLSCASLDVRMVQERSLTWFPSLDLVAAYAPWVAAQPLAGALAAWLSHRAGGSRPVKLCAALFPSIVMLACWGLVIPASAMFEGVWAARHPAYMLLGAFVWVAPAAMGLLFGCLPFLSSQKNAGVPAESR